jgi:hypothetical protein
MISSVKKVLLAGALRHMGETRNAYNNLARKPEIKGKLERPSPRWVYNIKTDLKWVWRCGLDPFNSG